MSLEIRAYDHGRNDGFAAISQRFLRLCQGLATVSPHLARFMGDAGGVQIPVETSEDADAIVGASARMWKLGQEELAAFGPSARSGISCRVALVAGIPPIDLPAWVPNQTVVKIDGPAEVELRSDPKLVVACLEQVLLAADPAWAVVASDGAPDAPVPPFDDGAPAVGWFTFLDAKYPPGPVALPEGATRRSIAGGTLYVAHGARPDAAAIARLGSSLASASVLVPARVHRGAERPTATGSA